MPDIFDRIKYEDAFTKLDFKDIFNRIDLPLEEKVIFSKEMKDLVLDEIIKKIGELPLGSLISSVVRKEIQKKLEKEIGLRAVVEKRLREADENTNKVIENKQKDILKKIEELEKELKEETKSIRLNMNQTIYEFGGYSPSFNFSNVFYFGDQNTDGSWRIVVDGTNLSVQYRESGVWIEKGSFLP